MFKMLKMLTKGDLCLGLFGHNGSDLFAIDLTVSNSHSLLVARIAFALDSSDHNVLFGQTKIVFGADFSGPVCVLL